jgi:hypothetical protein
VGREIVASILKNHHPEPLQPDRQKEIKHILRLADRVFN